MSPRSSTDGTARPTPPTSSGGPTVKAARSGTTPTATSPTSRCRPTGARRRDPGPRRRGVRLRALPPPRRRRGACSAPWASTAPSPPAAPERDLAVAMIVASLLEPRTKLATARALRPETAASSLGQLLDLGDENDLYAALDCPGRRRWRPGPAPGLVGALRPAVPLLPAGGAGLQPRQAGDAAGGVRAVVPAEGCPVAEGNTVDSATVTAQVEKLRELRALAGGAGGGSGDADRGPDPGGPVRGPGAGLDHRAALHRPPPTGADRDGAALAVRGAGPGGSAGAGVPRGAAGGVPQPPGGGGPPAHPEGSHGHRGGAGPAAGGHPPGGAAAPRARHHRAGHPHPRPPPDGKHFEIETGPGHFAFRRREARIAEEAALDGFYVVRTNVPADALPAPRVVAAYKQLRRWRRLVQDLLPARPNHWRADRVRAHFFLRRPTTSNGTCAAASRRSSSSPAAAEAARESVVERPDQAARKTEEGSPSTPSTPSSKTSEPSAAVRIADTQHTFDQLTELTPLQRRAFDLLAVSPNQ